MRRVIRWAIIAAAAVILLTVISRLFLPSGPTGPVIGVIEIRGVIAESQDRWEQDGAGTPQVLRQIDEARRDPRVEAVVVRINSPGGSPAASQEIHDALMRLREDGRPVIASLADTAASGGYYVALAAEKIIANPATTTGSIGVIMQVTTVERLLDNWGIDVELMASGPFKSLGNPFRPLSPTDREVLNATVQDIHDQFVEAVAEGRGLSVERVRELADGRVYTGRQALELGLVDDLGGFDDAVQLASQLAGLEPTPPLLYFHRPAALWERILGPVSALIHRAGSMIGWTSGREGLAGPDPSVLDPGGWLPKHIQIVW